MLGELVRATEGGWKRLISALLISNWHFGVSQRLREMSVNLPPDSYQRLIPIIPGVNGHLVIQAGESKIARCNISRITSLCAIGYENWCVLTKPAQQAARLRWIFNLDSTDQSSPRLRARMAPLLRPTNKVEKGLVLMCNVVKINGLSSPPPFTALCSPIPPGSHYGPMVYFNISFSISSLGSLLPILEHCYNWLTQKLWGEEKAEPVE